MRRRQKHGHESGAWKVAFGDLMVCLMCTFLLLWVIQATTNAERKEIADAIKSDGDVAALDYYIRRDTIKPLQIREKAKDNQTENIDIRNTSILRGQFNTLPDLQMLAMQLAQKIRHFGASDHVNIQVIPDGVKISFHDADNRMFPRGSSKLSFYFEDLMMHFSDSIRQIDNAIMFAGHTDNLVFSRGASISNWELSANRANTVRDLMVTSGVNERGIVQVVGLASTQPLDKINLGAPINRRVELILLTKSAELRLRGLYRSDMSQSVNSGYAPEGSATEEGTPLDTNNAIRQAKAAAKANQPVSRLDSL
ncbi:OmpA family protein [Vibrio sp.]|nr:OmpA family protein [Vibrio sp.]